MTGRPVLDIDSVSKGFGAVEVLRRVSVRVEPGSVVAIVGHNGAGKTTLMRMALGLVRPDSGEIRQRGVRSRSDVIGQHAYAKPGTYTVTVTVTDALEEYVSTSVSVTTAGSDYTAYGPLRLLDTRNGTGAPKAKLTSAAPIKLRIAGNGKIPASATAVTLNLTLTNATGNGNIVAYPDGSTVQTSNLNYSAGQTVANLAIVPIGPDGYVDLAKQGPGAVDMIADVEGYFTRTAASGYTATSSPTRILDTRTAVGAPKRPLTSATPIKLQIFTRGGVPAGVTAVALNLTLTDSAGSGDVSAYPDGTTRPTASNLNYSTGQTVANAAIVPVGKDGYIDLVKQGPGSVDVIADVEGYYGTTGSGAYVPVSPLRLLDTRSASWGQGPLPKGDYIYMPLAYDSDSVQLTNVIGFVLNTTVTNTSGNGFLTVAPDPNTLAAYQAGSAVWPAAPNASNLNWTKGQTIPNLVQASTGTTGIIDFWNLGNSSRIDLIVDAFGYYQTG